jgi:hypothetical protein
MWTTKIGNRAWLIASFLATSLLVALMIPPDSHAKRRDSEDEAPGIDAWVLREAEAGKDSARDAEREERRLEREAKRDSKRDAKSQKKSRDKSDAVSDTSPSATPEATSGVTSDRSAPASATMSTRNSGASTLDNSEAASGTGSGTKLFGSASATGTDASMLQGSSWASANPYLSGSAWESARPKLRGRSATKDNGSFLHGSAKDAGSFLSGSARQNAPFALNADQKRFRGGGLQSIAGVADPMTSKAKKVLYKGFLQMNCLEFNELGANYYTAERNYRGVGIKYGISSKTAQNISSDATVNFGGRDHTIQMALPGFRGGQVFLYSNDQHLIAIDPRTYDAWVWQPQAPANDVGAIWKKLTHRKPKT